MMTPRADIPITRQVEMYEQHARDALTLMREFILQHADVIIRTEILRMTSIGAAEYGDATWHRTATDCALEGLHEASDWSMYFARVRQATGSLSAAREALALTEGTT